MTVTVSRAVQDILARAAVTDGHTLRIGQRLDPRAYARVSTVLEAAGGTWDRRAQAHRFPGDAGEALAGLLSAGRVTSATQEQGWFATPPEVVARLLDVAAVTAGMTVLEPSAGEGAIAGPLAARRAVVDCIEQHPGRAASLAASGFARSVTTGDFLSQPQRPVYDRVVMNPPFAGGADVAHVRHALKFVSPGGQLTAVMSAGLRFRGRRQAEAVRELAVSSGGMIEDVPEGAFSSSGTDIATVIVVIHVPGPVPATPVRVTTDHTAAGVPLFDAAAARPGVYVRYCAWIGRDTVFRFAGPCVGCGAKTWQHDDSDDDRRGPFGEYTCMPLTAENFPGGPRAVPAGTSFPRCGACWDDGKRTRTAITRATAHLRQVSSRGDLASTGRAR